ncbi:Piso0_004582 [Millerozyma farinosa CBS 7064]|uniref:Piso0_004582 protein n=1 Tax=Pichia sorbitophila (strain ATCC MYA-4447 / BCRC 22081 / CBS 7064 / NBRC 10061 / NRRL Y-12695) TaxID=559304 RepID=G8Y5V5_PICSO|nr:Piso0_004582 [Millerozyma farinosa CBS 7064]CCE85016.1 Piso0_004582 [Millerozyma farinosa CBS 7064]
MTIGLLTAHRCPMRLRIQWWGTIVQSNGPVWKGIHILIATLLYIDAGLALSLLSFLRCEQQLYSWANGWPYGEGRVISRMSYSEMPYSACVNSVRACQYHGESCPHASYGSLSGCDRTTYGSRGRREGS